MMWSTYLVFIFFLGDILFYPVSNQFSFVLLIDCDGANKKIFNFAKS